MTTAATEPPDLAAAEHAVAENAENAENAAAARRFPTRPTPPSPIPRAKVSPPPTLGLPRERVLRLLRDAEGARLVVMTGPPGAGKTTLLAHFAQEQMRRESADALAWCRIEGQDAAAGTLTRTLGAAVTLALEGDARPLASSDDLLALMETSGRRLTLVVDDAHVLADTEAERTLARIIALLPTHVQVILGARAEPRFVSSGPRLSSAVLDVSSDDLRFRSWEVEQLFRDCYRAPLPPEDAAALTRHTEGWAAGLAMFHLATEGKPLAERRRAVASLWGMSRLLRAYLASNVLAALPPGVADFLVLSSALGILEGTLCDRMLDRGGSQALLRELADRHLFTVRCDDDGWYYRYHAVLQTQLESMLAERLGPEGARAWYRRAATLLEESGHWPEAYRGYARAEDWGAGAQLLQRCGVRSAEAEAAEASVAPGLLDGDPWLCLAEARRHRAAGRLVAATEAFERAERRFTEPRMKQHCRRDRRAVAAWSAAGPRGPGAGDEWWGQLRAAVCADPAHLSRRAAGREEPHWRLAAGLAAALDSRPYEGLRALHHAAAGSDGFVSLAARLAAATIEAALGRPVRHDTGALALEADIAGIPWLARVARSARVLCDPRALDEVRAVRDEADRDGDVWGALLAALFLAIGELRAGVDPAEGLVALADRARRLDAGVIEAWARSLQEDPSRLTDLVAQADAHPQVALRCFGRFSLRVDGRELDWHRLRPRARATLRLLSLHAGQAVHEETLVDALWPAMPLQSGKHNLQVAVSAVRKLLEPGRPRNSPTMLQRRGACYLLRLPEGSDADILTFGQAIRRWRSSRTTSPAEAKSALRTALAAYAGDLLPEDGPAEWVVAERDRLRAEAADAGAALAEFSLAAGDHLEAVEACQRALAAEPLHDAAWRLLGLAYDHAGDTAAAERARRRYAAALTELGVMGPAPSPPGEELHLGDGGRHLRR